jgi:hypothetical protein
VWALGAPSGEDAERWCAARVDEEHGRCKGRSGVRHAGVDFIRRDMFFLDEQRMRQ